MLLFCLYIISPKKEIIICKVRNQWRLSVKNKLEKLIFHTAICAGAPQIALMAEEKSPSQISLRPVANAPEWRLI